MAANPQHEPTMEEILASIRKIISEDSNDNPDAKAANGASAPSAVENDVYELREADVLDAPAPTPVETARVVVMPAPRPAPQPTVPVHEESQVNAPVSVQPAEAHDGFFSESTRKAMHETFARLEPASEEEPAPAVSAATTPAPEGASVQAVFEHAVRENIAPVATAFLGAHVDEIVERMKPIVREWMDEHFPAILEGAVRNEVERAVKAAAAAKTPRR